MFTTVKFFIVSSNPPFPPMKVKEFEKKIRIVVEVVMEKS